MTDISKIVEAARILNLQNIAHGYIELEDKPELSNLDYLYWVLSQEIEMRQEAAMAKREKESKLPYKEFLKSRVNEGIAWQIDRLESLQWIDEFQNLIIIGECDKGKTSLASHLGRRALEAGEKVSYRSDRHQRQFRYITQPSVVIIDDMMYARIPDEHLPKLYHALTFLNETRSLIVITNRELSTWSNGAEDTHMVETLVSRLTAGS